MTGKTKAIIFISVFGVLTIGGIALIIRNRNKGLGSFGKNKDKDLKNPNKGNTGVTSPNLIDGENAFDPSPYADRLYKSMSGAGTRESEFFAVYDELNDSERIQVNRFFDEANVGKGSTLAQWVEGDFCNWWDNAENCEKAKNLIKY
jgi:hypothetical protein